MKTIKLTTWDLCMLEELLQRRPPCVDEASYTKLQAKVSGAVSGSLRVRTEKPDMAS